MTGVADINFKCRSYSTIARWKRTCFSFFVHIISILFIVCVSFCECPSQIQIELSITTRTQLLDFVIQLSLSLSLNWFGNLFHSHNPNHEIAGTRFHHHFEISMPNSTEPFSILPHRYSRRIQELISIISTYNKAKLVTVNSTKYEAKNKIEKNTEFLVVG